MDRFTRGFILGVISSAIKDAINLLDYYVFHITNIRYPDFMASLVFGRHIKSMFELIICQILELGYEGILGIMFIYLAYRTHNKRNLWFKGFIFGTTAYIINYTLGAFYKLPVMQLVDAKSVISQVLTSAIFGVLMGMGVYWWGKKSGDFKDK
jgi:uncharacterized membrane protein